MFQDPYASLDPRMRVGAILRRAADHPGHRQPQEPPDRGSPTCSRRSACRTSAVDRFPHEFSGGQRQRIGLARALMLNPAVIVADEPVSALDVSIRSQVLNLMKRLQAEHNLTYVVISHDLAVVKYLADRIGVMYLGRMVETGSGDDIYHRAGAPLHRRAADRPIPMPGPDRRAHQGRGRRPGRAAQPDQPALGLPVPYPLPAGPAAVRRRGAAAAVVRPGPPGRLPLPAAAAGRRRRRRSLRVVSSGECASKDYGPDPLSAPLRPRRQVRVVDAEIDLVVETADSGFCGAIVAMDKSSLTLEDRHGRRRLFGWESAAYLLDGETVTLRRPVVASPVASSRTASGIGRRARPAGAGGAGQPDPGRGHARLRADRADLGCRPAGRGASSWSSSRAPTTLPRWCGRSARARRPGSASCSTISSRGSKESRIAAEVEDPHVLVVGSPVRGHLAGGEAGAGRPAELAGRAPRPALEGDDRRSARCAGRRDRPGAGFSARSAPGPISSPSCSARSRR